MNFLGTHAATQQSYALLCFNLNLLEGLSCSLSFVAFSAVFAWFPQLVVDDCYHTATGQFCQKGTRSRLLSVIIYRPVQSRYHRVWWLHYFNACSRGYAIMQLCISCRAAKQWMTTMLGWATEYISVQVEIVINFELIILDLRIDLNSSRSALNMNVPLGLC